MIKTTCIQKFRDGNNKIIGYRLKDEQGSIKDFTAKAVKEHIKAKRIDVNNLTLSSNNRLVSKEPTKQIEKQLDITKILNRAILLDLKITEIPTCCEHTCYLISKTYDDHILYIPDDVEIPNIRNTLNFTAFLKKLKGTLKVVGGQSLRSMESMFEETEFDVIDLSQLNTSKVTDMSDVFYACKATKLIIDKLDTSQVRDMTGMFKLSCVIELDLYNFNTSKVENMREMFESCQASKINISKLDTSQVRDMDAMFKWCKAEKLDFSNFRTSNVVCMNYMFHGCTTQYLNLSRFITPKVTSMYKMFYDCGSMCIDISNMRIKDSVLKNNIFDLCDAQIKIKDTNLLLEYKER